MALTSQTREQEELEELLLLEQQGNEQRRLEVLQEEQRQLQAKRKNKQALLDELVSITHSGLMHEIPAQATGVKRTVTNTPTHRHRVH